jgi:hypothetical protein
VEDVPVEAEASADEAPVEPPAIQVFDQDLDDEVDDADGGPIDEDEDEPVLDDDAVEPVAEDEPAVVDDPVDPTVVAPLAADEPVAAADTEPEPEPEPEPVAAAEPEPIRAEDATDPGTLRPKVPGPERSRGRRAATAARATIELLVLIVVAGIVLAAAIGVTVGGLAFALRQTIAG